MNRKRLNEVYKSKMDIKKEGKRPGVLCVIEGKFGEYGKVNRNNRLYERSLWESVISSPFIQEALKNKTFFGEADHPQDDRVDPTLGLVSHSITDLWLEGNEREGFIMGRADVLDTACGKIAHTLLEYGSVLGISSRAFGDTEKTSEGYDRIVEDGFECTAFDFVTMPGFECARLPLKEGKGRDCEEFNSSMKANIASMSAPELKDVRSIFVSAGEFGRDLLEDVDKRLESISSSEDPVVLVEEGERKAQYYKKRSELGESVLSRVSENAKKVIYSRDEEIERLRKSLKEEGEVPAVEDLVLKEPEFPEGEKADLAVGKEVEEEDKESTKRLLKAMGRSKEILSAELGEVKEDYSRFKSKMGVLRENYKESLKNASIKSREIVELSRSLEESNRRVVVIENEQRGLLEGKTRAEAQLAEAVRREKALKEELSNLQETNSGLQGEIKEARKKLGLAESVARSVVKASEKKVIDRPSVDFSLRKGDLVEAEGLDKEERRLTEFLKRARGENGLPSQRGL